MLPFFGIDKHGLSQCLERDNAVYTKKPLFCPACKMLPFFGIDKHGLTQCLERETTQSIPRSPRCVQHAKILLPSFGTDKHGLTQCLERNKSPQHSLYQEAIVVSSMQNTTFLRFRQARIDTVSRERDNAVYIKKLLFCPACKILPSYRIDKHGLTQCLVRNNAVYTNKPWLCPACKMLPSFEQDKHVLTVAKTDSACE